MLKPQKRLSLNFILRPVTHPEKKTRTKEVSSTRLLLQGPIPSPRSGMQSAQLSNVVLLHGGYTKKIDGYLNDSYLVSRISEQIEEGPTIKWTELKCKSKPSPRIDFALCKQSNSSCVLFGGSDGYQTLNDLHVFDLGRTLGRLITKGSKNDRKFTLTDLCRTKLNRMKSLAGTLRLGLGTRLLISSN